MRKAITLTGIAMFVISLTVLTCRSQLKNDDCKDLAPSLLTLTKRSGDENKALSRSFEIGDKCINNLISILNGSDFQMSVAAQEVIRYLGNEEGLKALEVWNKSNTRSYPVRGPVPVPIMNFDYDMIEVNFIGNGRKDFGLLTSSYLYALAIDKNCDRSRDLMRKMLKGLDSVDKGSVPRRMVDRLVANYPLKTFSASTNLERTVLQNAFFLSDEDKDHTDSNLLAFNGDNDKALIELRLSRGILAEEWYHVVVKKAPNGWEFYSITFIKQS